MERVTKDTAYIAMHRFLVRSGGAKPDKCVHVSKVSDVTDAENKLDGWRFQIERPKGEFTVWENGTRWWHKKR